MRCLFLSDQILSLPVSPSSSVLSDIPPPHKKRRISLSSLSDAGEDDDDDEEEEDKPLAARIGRKPGSRSDKSSRVAPGHRSGKKGPTKGRTLETNGHGNAVDGTAHSGKSKGSKGTTSGKTNGVNGFEHKVKVEEKEKMDENQITRLVTGVTVDTSSTSAGV